MNRRTKHIGLAIASCLVIPLQLFAQVSATSQAAPRDPEALKLLTSAFNQAGGAQAWQSIHGSRVKGTLKASMKNASGQKDISNSIVWVDDWSTGRPRYNRTTTNAKGVTRTQEHSDSPTFTTQYKNRTIAVKQFDTTSVLLTHLPGAALAKILSDKSYAITPVAQAKDPTHSEVMVSKIDGSVMELWFVNKQSSQVDAVRYTVPDAFNTSHRAWDIAIYDHYRNEGGRSVPDRVTVVWPNSMSIKLELDSLETNPAVSNSDFGKDAGQ